MKSVLPAALGLVFVALGASHATAGEITNTTFLSSFTATATPHGNSQGWFDISFTGVFQVPEVAPGLTIIDASVKMEYDFGVASWSQNVPGNIYGGALNGGAGWGIQPGVGWIEKYNTSNDAEGPLWQVALSHKQAGPGVFTPEQFSADGPYAANGYVPYYFRLDATFIAPSSDPVAVDPSFLVYIGGLRLLTVVDVAQPVSAGNGDVATGPSSGLVWALARTGSGGDVIPAALKANLPSYIPNTISAVPEPAAVLLMSVGVAVLFWRRRVLESRERRS